MEGIEKGLRFYRAFPTKTGKNWIKNKQKAKRHFNEMDLIKWKLHVYMLQLKVYCSVCFHFIEKALCGWLHPHRTRIKNLFFWSKGKEFWHLSGHTYFQARNLWLQLFPNLITYKLLPNCKISKQYDLSYQKERDKTAWKKEHLTIHWLRSWRTCWHKFPACYPKYNNERHQFENEQENAQKKSQDTNCPTAP